MYTILITIDKIVQRIRYASSARFPKVMVTHFAFNKLRDSNQSRDLFNLFHGQNFGGGDFTRNKQTIVPNFLAFFRKKKKKEISR